MKLCEIEVSNILNGTCSRYLKVGESEEDVEKRETEVRNEMFGHGMFFVFAKEITEVDGHKIIVE